MQNYFGRIKGNTYLGQVECAEGVRLLARAGQMNKEKRNRALKAVDALADYPKLVFHREASTLHNYHLLVAQAKDELRDVFMRHLVNNQGIQCVVQYCPLNRYPFHQDLGFGVADCPNTDVFFDNMVPLSFNHLLTDREIDEIVSAFRETPDNRRQ